MTSKELALQKFPEVWIKCGDTDIKMDVNVGKRKLAEEIFDSVQSQLTQLTAAQKKIEERDARIKVTENRIVKLSEENAKLNDAKDFLIKYYNPQDTRFKSMIDSFVSFDDEQKNKLIKLAQTLAELKL